MVKRTVGAFLVAVVIAGVALAPAASHAETTPQHIDVEFHAPVPCSFACPYWTDPVYGNDSACKKDPFAPPMSWDEHRFTIPETVNGVVPTILHFEMRPTYDFDAWLCRVIHPGTPDEFYKFVTYGASIPEDCTSSFFGCRETIDLCIVRFDPECDLRRGEVYVFRVYNWFDPTQVVRAFYEWL